MDITSPRFNLINVGHAVHSADWNWKNVCSPFTRIFYIVSGTAWIEFETFRQKLLPGHIYIIPPFARHDYKCDGHFELMYVHMYETSTEREYEQLRGSLFDTYNMPTEMVAQPNDEWAMRRLCSLWPDLALKHSNPKTYDNTSSFIDTVRRRRSHATIAVVMETEGLLLQLLSRFLQNSVVKHMCNDSRMIKAIGFIQRNIDRHVSVDDVANVMCVSRNHCIRLFGSAIGQTTMQYINSKKMERAQLLLVTTNLSIKDVAAKLGYDDFSYFTRLFKKLVGKSPVEFRESV